MEAEPVIRAGKAAYDAHRVTEKASQTQKKREREKKGVAAAKAPRGAKMREAEEANAREIEANDPALRPVWNRVRRQMYARAKKSGGTLSAVEAFWEYVMENPVEVAKMLDALSAPKSRDLAQAQAQHAKKKARAAGNPVPSEAFHVPSKRAPASSKGKAAPPKRRASPPRAPCSNHVPPGARGCRRPTDHDVGSLLGSRGAS